MWKTLSEWLLAFFNMARELQEHRTTLRQQDQRIRDLEEALKLLAQEQRHAREIEASEREKLLLRLDAELKNQKALPSTRRRKR